MRLDEFASAEDQLALWKLVSDSVWTSISIQAKQEARAKAAKKRKAAPKRATGKPPPPVPVRAPAAKVQNPVRAPIPSTPTTPIRPQPTRPISSIGSTDAQNTQKVAGQNNPISNGTAA